MSLGVHRIEKSSTSSAYFVTRSFGNYLIYPDALTDFNEDLFKSRGGVYRQLIHDVDLISLSQVRLFKTFGASAVLHESHNGEDTDSMPLEFFGTSFIDPTAKLNKASWEGLYWMMKQGSEKVVFLSPEHLLTSSDEIFIQDKDISEEAYDYFESIGASYLFFSDHEEGHHFIQL